MIKKIALAAITALTVLSACKEGDESNMPYIEKMKDSIFNKYPTVMQVTIDVKDGSILDVTLGDAHMYNTPDDNRQQVANGIGAMALRIFPKSTSLNKGHLMVSKDEKSIQPDAATIKTTDINLDSLRRVNQ